MGNRIKILFPTDFSDYSVEVWKFAVGISNIYDADLVLVHVVEPPTGVIKFLSEFNEELALKQAHKMMDRFISTIDTEDVSVTKMVKIGKPSREIGRVVLEIDAGLIVMGTHGASGIQQYLVGSNTSSVVRSAPCPVLSVREVPEDARFNKILLPLDLTKETGEKVANCVKIARKFRSEIQLVSVLPAKSDASEAKLRAKMETVENYCKKQRASFTSQFVHAEGSVSETVLKFAEENGTDLICVMTQQELQVKELVMGSEAGYIVNRSKVPVVSIRPKNMFSTKGKRSYFG